MARRCTSAGLLAGLLVGGLGCDKDTRPSATLGYKPIGIPVKVSIDTSGKVAVSADRELRTPIGTFTLDLALEKELESNPDGPSPARSPSSRPQRLRIEPARGAPRAAIRPAPGWQRSAFTSLPSGTEVLSTGRAVRIPEPSGKTSKLWVEIEVNGRLGWIHEDNLEPPV